MSTRWSGADDRVSASRSSRRGLRGAAFSPARRGGWRRAALRSRARGRADRQRDRRRNAGDRAVLRRASGRHRHAAAGFTPISPRSISPPTNATTSIDLLRAWTAAAARMTRGETADAARRRPRRMPRRRFRRCARPRRRRPHDHVRLRPGSVHQGRQGPLRPGAGSARPRWSICRASTATSCSPDHTGGDLSIQACANDPQVAFHAVRQLARIAYGAATMRWAQAGFSPVRAAQTRRAT